MAIPNTLADEIYKYFLVQGISEDKAEGIKKSAFNYFDAITALYDREYTYLLRVIGENLIPARVHFVKIVNSSFINNLNTDELSTCGLYTPIQLFNYLENISVSLYKDLVDAGDPEKQAEVIKKAATGYIENITKEYDREYEKLLRAIRHIGLKTR